MEIYEVYIHLEKHFIFQGRRSNLTFSLSLSLAIYTECQDSIKGFTIQFLKYYSER